MMRRISHPNIVRYYKSQVVDSDRTLNILMEMCDNKDLGHFIKARNGQMIPECQIWKFLIEMCQGL